LSSVLITNLFDVQEIFGGERDDAAAVNRCVVLERTVISDVCPHGERHRLQLINKHNVDPSALAIIHATTAKVIWP